ncbi:MAG: penicillin-binding protein 2 [Verrucomicrobiales bacterium]
MDSLAAGLSVRLFTLHGEQGEHYREQAWKEQFDGKRLPARRGGIYDSSGELLAGSLPVFDVVADLTHLRDAGIAARGVYGARKDEFGSVREVQLAFGDDELRRQFLDHAVRVLARPLGYRTEELHDLLASGTGSAELDDGLELEAARRIEMLLEENGIGGIYVREREEVYPSPERLTHVIGYLDATGKGREGVEGTMEEFLRGTEGYRLSKRTGGARRSPPTETIARRRTAATYSDHRHADQDIAERALDHAMVETKAERAVAIVMDPHTGDILALVNRPHFNLNTRIGSLRNVAVSDAFEPGSTFKIVTYSTAYERRLVHPQTIIDCEGASYYDPLMKETLGDHHGYGELSVEMAFAKSTNIGAYKIAKQIGGRELFEAALAFGFGKKTGLNLNAESPGKLREFEKWSNASLWGHCKGYEVSATPLQVARMLCVVANGGWLVQPRVVDRVVSANGNLVRKFPNGKTERLLSDLTIERMTSAMLAVTGDDGTGKQARVPGYHVAGKTGTARKYIEGVGYADGGWVNGVRIPPRYTVSFAGFLPAQAPRIACLVVVDDPQGDPAARFGGSVCGPVFSRIASQTMAYLDVPPDSPEELSLPEPVAAAP